MKSVKITYFAILKDERGLSEETLDTNVNTAEELFRELKSNHSLSLEPQHMRVAVNDQIVGWQHQLKGGDEIVFLPPVAGG